MRHYQLPPTRTAIISPSGPSPAELSEGGTLMVTSTGSNYTSSLMLEAPFAKGGGGELLQTSQRA